MYSIEEYYYDFELEIFVRVCLANLTSPKKKTFSPHAYVQLKSQCVAILSDEGLSEQAAFSPTTADDDSTTFIKERS